MSELATAAAAACGALAVLAGVWPAVCRYPGGRVLGGAAAGLGALISGTLVASETLAMPVPLGLVLLGWVASLALALVTLSWASREWQGSQTTPLLFGVLVLGCDLGLAVAFLRPRPSHPAGVERDHNSLLRRSARPAGGPQILDRAQRPPGHGLADGLGSVNPRSASNPKRRRRRPRPSPITERTCKIRARPSHQGHGERSQ